MIDTKAYKLRREALIKYYNNDVVKAMRFLMLLMSFLIVNAIPILGTPRSRGRRREVRQEDESILHTALQRNCCRRKRGIRLEPRNWY